MDVAPNQIQLERQLDAVVSFTQKSSNPLQTLICDEPAEVEEVKRLCLVHWNVEQEVAIREYLNPHNSNLNRSQKKALAGAMRNRLF